MASVINHLWGLVANSTCKIISNGLFVCVPQELYFHFKSVAMFTCYLSNAQTGLALFPNLSSIQSKNRSVIAGIEFKN